MSALDVAVLSPVCPFTARNGHGLAVLSDITAITDNHLSVGVLSFVQGDEPPVPESGCAVQRVPIRKGGFSRRFIRGFFSAVPPSAERFYSPAAFETIRERLREWQPEHVILDDSLVSGYIALIRSELPRAKIILRSHNVMRDVRVDQLGRTRDYKRPAVSLDCKRFIEFERAAVAGSDAHWTITPTDAERMKELYGKGAECLTVSIDVDRYQDLATGDGADSTFIHVGTLDFRRRGDLRSFLEVFWPKIRAADGKAKLILAGSLFGLPIHAENVSYLGPVSNDVDVYRLGRFALNFQSSTGGLKLKSLTSLAAGRTLVSTVEGVEGLPLKCGEHYWNLDSFVSHAEFPSLEERLSSSFRNVAAAGRQYVKENHSRSTVARRFLELIRSV